MSKHNSAFFILAIFFIFLGITFAYYFDQIKELEGQEVAESEKIIETIDSEMKRQIDLSRTMALKLANNGAIQRTFSERDRERLLEMLLPSYEVVSNEIPIIHFHLPDSTSFLRLHLPHQYGDSLKGFRHTVNHANQQLEITKGLEEGVAGFGHRVVVPMFHQGAHIGSVECSMDFGEKFIFKLKDKIGFSREIFLYIFGNYPYNGRETNLIAATATEDRWLIDDNDLSPVKQGQTIFLESADSSYRFELVPFYDYSGEVKGYIKIVKDRSDTLARILHIRQTMGLSSITFIGILALYFVISEKRRAEKKLQYELSQRLAAEENVDILIEKSSDGLIVVGQNGEYLFINPSAHNYIKLFGRETFKEKLIVDNMSGDTSKEIELINERHAVTLEIKCNKLFWRGHNASLIEMRDITERKKWEAELKKYSKQIEEKNVQLELAYDTIKADIDKAYLIHQQFLPKEMPTFPNIGIASHFKPAKSLGGDFYFLKQLENDNLFFYLSDVSGHGLDGALLNIFVKNTIDGYINDKIRASESFSPKDVLEHLHRSYCQEEFPDDYFVCLTCGVLNLKSYELICCSAGMQIAPIIISPEGEIIDLDCVGVPISVVISPEIAMFENIKTVLPQGSLLFFTTDGLIEEIGINGEMYGVEHIKTILRKNRFNSTSEISNQINADFSRYTGASHGTDDITYLVIQISYHKEMIEIAI